MATKPVAPIALIHFEVVANRQCSQATFSEQIDALARERGLRNSTVASERSIVLYEKLAALKRVPLPLDSARPVTMYWRHDMVPSTAVTNMPECVWR